MVEAVVAIPYEVESIHLACFSVLLLVLSAEWAFAHLCNELVVAFLGGNYCVDAPVLAREVVAELPELIHIYWGGIKLPTTC